MSTTETNIDDRITNELTKDEPNSQVLKTASREMNRLQLNDREQEEKNFKTKKDMLNEIDTLLGGRAAEEIILGDISTGASNDIARATDIIKSMITDFGMSDKFKNMTLGRGVLGNRNGEPNLIREFSEETQKFIDEEIARIMDNRYNYVIKLLEDKKDLLEYISKRLLEIETMDGKEFEEIIKAHEHCGQLEEKALSSQEEEVHSEGEKGDNSQASLSETENSDNSQAVLSEDKTVENTDNKGEQA